MATQFPANRTLRLTWAMDDQLARLARKRGTGIQATLRQLIYEAARAEGIETREEEKK